MIIPGDTLELPDIDWPMAIKTLGSVIESIDTFSKNPKYINVLITFITFDVLNL